MKVDILAFGAHPDDIELGCGGTIYKSTQNGKTVGFVDLTEGELGTRGNSKIRASESSKAARILGASFRDNLKFPDGFISNTKENLLKLIKKIRLYQPDIILCNAPDDRHPDHSKSNTLVREACYLSGLAKIRTEDLNGVNQSPWRPYSIFSYIQWKSLNPSFVVDISSVIDQKLKAVNIYKSQFYDPLSTEPETPISSQNFINSVKYRAADLGRTSFTDYAEGFISFRPILVKSIFDLK